MKECLTQLLKECHLEKPIFIGKFSDYDIFGRGCSVIVDSMDLLSIAGGLRRIISLDKKTIQ